MLVVKSESLRDLLLAVRSPTVASFWIYPNGGEGGGNSLSDGTLPFTATLYCFRAGGAATHQRAHIIQKRRNIKKKRAPAPSQHGTRKQRLPSHHTLHVSARVCVLGGVLIVSCRALARRTIAPRIPTPAGRSTSGFHRPGRHCVHQAHSAVGHFGESH